MKRLLVLILFALGSQAFTTSINQPVSDLALKQHYLYEFQIYKTFSEKVSKANKLLNVRTQVDCEYLPIGCPIDSIGYKTISSLYGIREKHPILRYTTMHQGIDISAEKGTKVFATASGRIKRRGYAFMGYGKFIEIEHGNNITTLYAHLHSIDVFEGDYVKTGTTIGTVGSTGLSTGNHLHYEVRTGNYSIDPLLLYLNEEEALSSKTILQKMQVQKLLQMTPKKVLKTLTLSELKTLKDSYVKSITAKEYDIKNNRIKKATTLVNALTKIEVKQENLIRVKELLAKANAIERVVAKGTEPTSNNRAIFQLGLLRDTKSTLTHLKDVEEFKETVATKLTEIEAKIVQYDSEIREFNNTVTIDIELIEEA